MLENRSEEFEYDGHIILPVLGVITQSDPSFGRCIPREGEAFSFNPKFLLQTTFEDRLLEWMSRRNDGCQVRSEDLSVERNDFLKEGRFKVHIPINSVGGNLHGSKQILALVESFKERGAEVSTYGHYSVCSGASNIWMIGDKRCTTEGTNHMWHASGISNPNSSLARISRISERVFGLPRAERGKLVSVFSTCEPNIQSKYTKIIDTTPRGEVNLKGRTLKEIGLAHECFEDGFALTKELERVAGIPFQESLNYFSSSPNTPQ